MKILYSPQRSDVPLSYTFDGETITASQAGLVDSFALSGLPDGREAIIESTLTPCPLLSARREAGELIVTLRSHHGASASHAERFPAEEIR